MVTRKEKREQEKNANYFFELIKTMKHFFKDLQKQLNSVNDPRHQSYTTYDSDILLIMTILKNACNLESMRNMTNKFNKDEVIENLKKAFGKKDLDELPPL